MEKMDMDHDGNVGGDEFLATLIDWGQVGIRKSAQTLCCGSCVWLLRTRELCCDAERA